jgi:hypothetical protein
MGGMYNALFGMNQAVPYLLDILKLTPEETGRLRDAYVKDGHIILYTRNGGGNREWQAEAITRMRNHPNYIKDWDWDFDSTYANFEFSVPDGQTSAGKAGMTDNHQLINLIAEYQGKTFLAPEERWDKMFGDMKAGNKTPDTERAAAVGKGIADQIKEHMDKDKK